MAVITLNPNTPIQDADWEGNNAAFTCPACGKVFIVSEQLHKGSRDCPCGKSTGNVIGGKKSGGKAYLRFEEPN